MKTMNILCGTDKNFLNPAYVTIASFIENHPGIALSFFVIAGADVSDDDKAKLTKYVKSKGHKVTFFTPDPETFKDYVTIEKFPISAYYRLLAHKFLPETIDRVLYVDVDLIATQNLYDDFYNIPLGDKYLAVTSHNPDESFFNRLDGTMLDMESAARGEYFNSGVILFNLKKFRETGIELEDYNEAYGYCVAHDIPVFYDQGLLNFMFADKSIYFSSMDYNFRYSIPRDYAKRLNPNRQYKKAIVHYTGMKQPYKPWDLRLSEEEVAEFGAMPYSSDYFYFSPDLHKLCEIWWSYAELTPVYDQIVHDVEVKNKWFRRNLADFVKRHNAMVADYQNLKKRPVQVKTETKTETKTVVQEKVVDKIIYQYPPNFKYRTYKVAMAVAKPFFAVRGLFKKDDKNTKK